MAKLKGKTVAASEVEMIEVVLPNDTNPLGNVLGGRVMHHTTGDASHSRSGVVERPRLGRSLP